MPDNADLMEMFEKDIDRLILVGHKQGLSYPRILYCMLHRLEELVLQCSTEQWIEQ